MPNGRPSWLTRLFRSQKPTQPIRRAPRAALGMEHLEDRTVPATVITIQEAAGTLDAFLSATDGTINATDSLGAAGTLSRAALQGVNPGVQISITAENSIIFDASLAAPIALQTAAGNSAQFIAVNGNITFQQPGDSLTTAGGSITLIVNSGALTAGTLASNGGNIDLLSDVIDIPSGAAINAGTSATGSIVTVRPLTAGTDVDLGTETMGELSLTAAELGRITAARVLRVGDGTTGDIAVTAAVTLAPGAVPTLSLQTGDTTATAITQTAALSVQNLAVRSVGTVDLTNAGNDVDTLAASVTGTAPNTFSFTDADDLQVATVDGLAGASVAGGNAANRITLTAGGALTQAAGANVTGPLLQLLGAGPVTLTNAGNDVATVAAALTGAGSALSYTDATTVTVGTVNATDGVSTNNGAVTLRVVAGTPGGLIVADTAAVVDLNAGTAAVTLSSEGLDGEISIVGVVNGSSALLTADRMGLDGGANADITVTGTATLRPFSAGRLIGLDNTAGDPTGVLRFSDGELDNVAAAVIVVGRNDMGNAAGDISVASAIDTANTNQLELVTGGSIAGAGSITEGLLGLTAGTGIGTSGTPLAIVVSNVEGTTATGGIFLANTGAALTIGGVNALVGLSVTGTTPASNISVTNDANISVSEAVSNASGGSVLLQATGAASNLATTAAVTATGGNGNVTLRADNNINVGAVVSAVGTGNVTVTADNDASAAGDLTTSAAISAADGNVTLSAADAITLNAGGTVESTGGAVSATVTDANGTLTVNAAVSAPSTTSPNGVVSFAADNMALAANVSAGRQVNIVPVNGPRAVDLGTETAGSLSLTDTELDFLLTPIINLGNATPVSTITVTAPITLANVVTTVFLNAGGDVTETGAGSFVMANTNSLLQFFVTGGLVNFANVANDVARVAGTLFNATSPFTYVDANTVAVTGISTSNGAVSVTSVAGAVNVTGNVTTGTGTATISVAAGTSFSLAASTTIQSGDAAAGGNITIRANVGAANGTEDIVLGANAAILTRGTITLDADPDNTFPTASNGVGGTVTIPGTATLAGPTNTLADDINIRGGEDITLGVLSATDDITVITDANIADDGLDTTALTAADIFLTAGGRVGGSTQIAVSDLESASTSTPTTTYLGAVDVAYTGTLTLTQTGALGNVQVRKTNAALATSTVSGLGAASFVGNGNQLALISAGGSLTFDNLVTINGGNNANTLFATVGAAGNDIVFGGAGFGLVNNGNATNTFAATGAVAASIDAPAFDSSPEVQVQNLVLHTTGGTVGAAGAPVEFNATLLNGRTTGSINGAAQAGGTAFLTDTTNGLTVGQFDAGTGNVTLLSNGNVGGSGVNLIAVTANDNVAEIIGNMVTIDTTAATSNGATGQIGSFTTTAQFFEVNATVLNASTNNSQLWVSEVGTGATAGAQIGLVTAGTNSARLRVRNGGNLTSEASDANVADVVGATVSLSAPEGGNFGAAGAANALEIDAATLGASVTGSGLINVTDVVGNGLVVQNATVTGTGDITLTAAGTAGPLTLGNGSTTGAAVVSTASGTVTLTGSAAIGSAATGAIIDVSGTAAAFTAVSGVGTAGTPLETAVGTLAATTATGGVFINPNTAATTTVGTVSGVTGVSTTTSGDISLTASAALTVSNAISAAGAGTVTLAATGATNINAAVSGAAVTANTGALTSTAPGTITATAGAVQLTSTGAVSLGGNVAATNGNVMVQGAGLVSNTGTVMTTTAGDVSLTATGAGNGVTVGGAVTSAGTVTVNAAGAANINAAVIGTGVSATGGTTLNTTGAVTTFGGGTVDLTASDGALTVGANVTAGATVTLTATDTAATTNNVVVNAGATVATNGTTININAGDAFTLNNTAALSTDVGGTVNVQVDQGAADVGVGGTVTFAASSNVVGATDVFVAGGADNDTFNLKPFATTTDITLTAAAGTDTLNIALTGATSPAFGNITGAGAGTFTFANRGDVAVTGVESIAASNGTYAVNFDLAAAGFQDANASPDVTAVASTGTNLTVSVQGNSTGTAQTLFTGRTADVNALTVAGSTDRDTFNVDLATAGVPALTITGGNPTTAPGDTLNLVNANVATGAAFAANGATGGTYSFANRNSIAFSQIETLPRPIVRVATTDANAGEGFPVDTGTFTFTRVGDLTSTLAVNYALSGSAANGVAYSFLTGTVTFAAGSATATVTLTPLNNSTIDGNRSATLALIPSAAYDLTTGLTVGTVTIADNDKVKTRVAVGSMNVGAGTLGTVAVFDNGSPNATFRFNPFPGYQGGVSVAVGDVTGDGVPDIIAASTDISSAVKVFDGVTLRELQSFLAFPGYLAGVTVAAGDLNNDGQAEVIVGTLLNNTAVSAFSFATGAPVAVFAQGNVFPNSGGGVTVAAGDTNGDGKAEIIVGARGGPAVKVFDITGATLASFVVPNAQGALNVGAGDIDGDGLAEILVGSAVMPTVGRVTVLNQGGGAKAQFDRPTAARFSVPTLGAADVNNDGKLDLLLGLPGVVSALDGNSFAALSSLTPFIGFQGGVFVG